MMKKNIEQIAREDGRYDVGAMKFVYEGLGHTVRKVAEEFENEQDRPRHITGPELSEGLKDLALEKWGRLARAVLEHWGLRTTRDFGEIVYLMISHQWMSSQTSDQIEDFDNIYDFKIICP